MKTHLTVWTLLLFIAALPCLADDHDKDKEEETIFGTWYAQLAEGELMPAEMTMKLDIHDNGSIVGTMSMEGGEPDIEKWAYTHDEENARLTLFRTDEDGKAQGEIEVVLTYSFVDEMLVFSFREDPEDEEDQTMELTRNKEGTERHQKMRKEQAEGDEGAFDVPEEK